MSLSAGSHLGPYEILELLGTGGMGEVFKARDTRLDRLVAIKVSREEFTERFQREARLVASLNHPHICTLYDVGSNYLVMEYVEGKPVRGPLPVKDVLRYGAQVASALDHAHRKGVVHRDLKPDNILLTKSGVKLLDFGLAKRFGPDDPTITIAGAVMGTPAYMAPEQWKGQDADSRTDIFAFGCLLYEITTGKSARLGIQPVQPLQLEWVIKHCLEEDPEERWQSAVDLRAELEHLRDKGPHPWLARLSLCLPWALAAAAAIVAVVFALLWRNAARRETPREVVRFAIPAPEGATLTNTVVVAPDGRKVAFTATDGDGKRLLYVRDLDNVSARSLPGTEGAYFPFWSPDSRMLGFFAAGALKKVEASASPPQFMAEAPNGVGGAWTPDGEIIFGPNSTGGLHRVPAGGGTPLALTTLDPALHEISHRRPSLLPGGRRFLFYASSDNPANQGIYLGSLDSPVKKLILPNVLYAGFASGFLLFVRERTLLSQPFDPDKARLEGEPTAVAKALSTFRSFSASDNGVLAYRSGEPGARGSLNWYDRKGAALGPAAPAVFSRYPSLSPDGGQLAVERLSSQIDSTDIWLINPARQMNSRFTFHPAGETGPVWSPDGKQIVFSSNREGPGDLYVKDVAGAGAERLLYKSPEGKVATDWSRDGRFIVFQTSGRGAGIWILPVAPGARAFPFRQTPFVEAEAQFSPEPGGPRWIAYACDETGRHEIYVQGFDASPSGGGRMAKWQVSSGGGRQPRWRADGRELYYIAPDGHLMAVEVTTGPSFAAGTPKPLFPTRIVVEPFAAFHYAVAPDGDRFLIDTGVEETTDPLTLLLNWPLALRR
ncbi:MAG: protein kinase [Bryobacteraceae bacterium]|nr:protein kinase [Bryobacteraceae bacterium]